jgi:hypothetical protein
MWRGPDTEVWHRGRCAYTVPCVLTTAQAIAAAQRIREGL